MSSKDVDYLVDAIGDIDYKYVEETEKSIEENKVVVMPKKNKWIAVAAITLVLFVGVGSYLNKNVNDNSILSDDPSQAAQDLDYVCKDMNEVKDILGFDLKCPDTILDSKIESINVIDDSIIDVRYSNGITIRKAKGQVELENVADNLLATDYLIGDRQVTLIQDGEGTSAVSWFEDGYSYSVDALGIANLDAVESVVASVS